MNQVKNEIKAKPNKEPEVSTKQKIKKEKKSTSNKNIASVGNFFQSILDGTFLTKENFVKQLPFIFFLVVLTICYIANTYYTEKIVRQIDKTKNELKELRSEYITIKSEYMNKSKQSEVAKRSASIGIKESLDPPKKIVFDNKNKKEIAE